MIAQAVADTPTREGAPPAGEAAWFRPAPLVEQRCWCGGGLLPSVHNSYGQCQRCGTHVLQRSFAPEELTKFYSLQGYWRDHQQRDCGFPAIEQRAENDLHDRIPVWHQILTEFHPRIGRLLEIGCAHGGFLHYCRERGVRDVVGIEVDAETCRFARERFAIEHVCAGLFPDVDLPFPKFDAIAGFDVIEHLTDPVAGVLKAAELLADDGVFFFQTPCYRGEPMNWPQFKPSEHTFLYNRRSIRELFARAGLELTHILPGIFPDDMLLLGRRRSRDVNSPASAPEERLGPQMALRLVEHASGFHAPEGRFRWMQRKALLRLPSDKLSSAMTLRFTLGAADLWCYGGQRVEAAVFTDGKLAAKKSFERNQQKHEITVRIKPRRQPQQVAIECSAGFVPAQLDARSQDQRQLALTFQDLSLIPA